MGSIERLGLRRNDRGSRLREPTYRLTAHSRPGGFPAGSWFIGPRRRLNLALFSQDGVELIGLFLGPDPSQVVEVVIGLVLRRPDDLAEQTNDGLVQAHAVLFGTQPDGGVDFGREIADCDGTHASTLASFVMHSMHHLIGSNIEIVTDFLRIPRVFEHGAQI